MRGQINNKKREQQNQLYNEKHNEGGQFLIALNEDLKEKFDKIMSGQCQSVSGKLLREGTGLTLKEIYQIHTSGKGYASQIEPLENMIQKLDIAA